MTLPLPLRRVFGVLLFTACLAGVMVAVRVWLVEPDAMTVRCSGDAALTWLCRLRSWAIQGFARQLYGPISLAAGILAWIGGSSYLSVLAMIIGMAGMCLYNFELAGVGMLLGALWLVHTPATQREPHQPQS